jgi:hypothetical protein
LAGAVLRGLGVAVRVRKRNGGGASAAGDSGAARAPAGKTFVEVGGEYRAGLKVTTRRGGQPLAQRRRIAEISGLTACFPLDKGKEP